MMVAEEAYKEYAAQYGTSQSLVRRNAEMTLLTSRQFAAALGVSPSLVRRWAASGELVPESRPSNRRSLFSPRDLARFRKRDRKRGPKKKAREVSGIKILKLKPRKALWPPIPIR